MAKKGPSLNKSKYNTKDYDNILYDASEDYDVLYIPTTPERKEIDEETLKAVIEEEAKLFGRNDFEEVFVESTPIQTTTSVNNSIETKKDRKLNFNEIQEPVIWGSNVLVTEEVIEEIVEEPEPTPVEETRRKRQGRPSNQEISKSISEEKPQLERKEKVSKEKKVKKEKPVKEKKSKKEKVSKRKTNAETPEELIEIQTNIEEQSVKEKKAKKEKTIKEKKAKKEKPTKNIETQQEKSQSDKSQKKKNSKYPKVYYDPTDMEIDEKDGKSYYYFNIEKTLRKYNLLFITKIIPLYKLEEMTFDNPKFDGIAQKQHEKAEKLNKLSAAEQIKYENKNKLIKVGTFIAIFFLIFSHINNNVIPKKQFEQGVEFMLSGQNEESYHIFNALGTKYDSHIYAKYNEGQVFFNLAKESSAGIAGKNLTEEEKQNLIKNAIEKYNKAKECFSLLTSYATSMTSVLNMSNENATLHIENLVKECDYSKARMFYQNGNFEEAAIIFKSIHTYSDATENYYKCMYEIADNYYEIGDYFLAIDYFYPVSKASYSDANTRLKELAQQLYEKASAAYEKKDYESAIENFAFLADYNYLDSDDMINKCRYSYALDFYQAKEYEKALDYFSDIEQYKDSLSLKKDCIYKLGVISYNKEPVSSIEYFNEIPGFKNSDQILNSDNLILYGEWQIVEMNGNSILHTTFMFDGKGLFKTNDVNVLGVAISTDYTPYQYKWDENGYKATMDNSSYILGVKIIDKDNLYLTAISNNNEYTYKCTRIYSYLDMLIQNNNTNLENEESLTLHQKLILLIEDYVELKTDGKFSINGVLTDITDTKSQLNNSLQEEINNSSTEETQ